MLVSVWSVKGGVGTTVVAAALAHLRSTHADGALLVDLAGDVPAALGMAEPTGPGLSGWVAAGPAVPPDALARLELAVAPGLALLPRGAGELADEERGHVLASLLTAEARAVVVDCGVVPASGPVAAVVAATSTRSVLVTRPCYLALRRAAGSPLRPSEVVVVSEPGRALAPADVEAAIGAPVRAVVAFDPAVARVVDAGLLARRLPRSLARSLRELW